MKLSFHFFVIGQNSDLHDMINISSSLIVQKKTTIQLIQAKHTFDKQIKNNQLHSSNYHQLNLYDTNECSIINHIILQ